MNPQKHHGKHYVLTGGKAIGYQELADALSRATQKTVVYQPVSMDEMGERIEKQGNDNVCASAGHFIFFSQSLIPTTIFSATDFLNFSFKKRRLTKGFTHNRRRY